MAHFRGPPAFQGRDDGPSGRHGPQNLGVARASASQPDERRHHASEYRDSRGRTVAADSARRGRRAVSRGRGGVRHRRGRRSTPRRCRWPGSSTSHRVFRAYEGDTRFPAWDEREWRLASSESFSGGKDDPWPFAFEGLPNGAKLRIYTTARPPRIPYLCTAKALFVY